MENEEPIELEEEEIDSQFDEIEDAPDSEDNMSLLGEEEEEKLDEENEANAEDEPEEEFDSAEFAQYEGLDLHSSDEEK